MKKMRNFTKLCAIVLMTSAMTQTMSAETYTRTSGGGLIEDPTKWSSGSIPVSGDQNIWSAGIGSLNATGNKTFYGGTFDIALPAGILYANGGGTLTLNNLTLNGGKILNNGANNLLYTLDLQNNTFTLNSGSLRNMAGNVNLNLSFKNCSLAGSGTITIAMHNAGTNLNYVELESTVNTTGFTGTFEVAPGVSGTGVGGMLKLNAIATASFGVSVPAGSASPGVLSNGTTYTSTVSGKLFFTAGEGNTVKLTSLNLGGTNIAVGTYTLAQLNEYLGGDLSAYLNQTSTGTITVVGTTTGLTPLVQNNLVVVKDKGFQLNNSTTSLQVYNSVGACIINKQNVSASTTLALPNTGMYVIKAKTENGTPSVQKIMIK